jgi:hypothetical protein
VAVDGDVTMSPGIVHSTAAAVLIESLRTVLQDKVAEMDERIGDLSGEVRTSNSSDEGRMKRTCSRQEGRIERQRDHLSTMAEQWFPRRKR